MSTMYEVVLTPFREAVGAPVRERKGLIESLVE